MLTTASITPPGPGIVSLPVCPAAGSSAMYGIPEAAVDVDQSHAGNGAGDPAGRRRIRGSDVRPAGAAADTAKQHTDNQTEKEDRRTCLEAIAPVRQGLVLMRQASAVRFQRDDVLAQLLIF